ncbi:Arf family GTPase CIN4 KNAG_0E02100 [Huiozyma naganishii CBS 8797]|uniref:Uncharacterized protein n=1 Tax=Huiozyma naganishii (strain ATCC MYA-139 / BCRC 22969 / CBS 8797 / KCTC 17520 / NBRC 10181 / NCYC 3082 / Yp74L-3) TaxID=1071383 RepID=J7RZ65_HUIN7|nr:hypothetical protein KNAG_0E02100 [Kazachstania naganishii CBS 8797]CCK70472.1 hypothetical protein KNAG_0E02100 [Kazachstania naganishii CBS 8797]
MGLLTIIKKQKIKDNEIRCLLLGLDNSGKSTVVDSLLPAEEREPENITPTLGFQIQSVVIDGQYNVSLWDIGGQVTLRPFWENYFDRTDALLWCVDVNAQLRFDESIQELRSLIHRDQGRIGYECQVIVLLNKIDLVTPNDFVNVELMERAVLDAFGLNKSEMSGNIRQKSVKFVQLSALTGQGITQLQEELVGIINAR